MTEADAVWISDPTSIVMKTAGDIVGLNDRSPSKTEDNYFVLHGGFRLMRCTETTIDLMHLILKSLTREKTFKSEQSIIEDAIVMVPELKIGVLDKEYFPSGRWYDYHSK